MVRGRDLTPEGRAIIHSKIKHHWHFENKVIMYGGLKKIRALCDNAGVPCCDKTVKRIAAEMNAQEELSEKIFTETGEVSGMVMAGTLLLSHNLRIPPI